MKNVRGSPIQPPKESPKAKLNPKTIQITEITPMAINDCNIVEITFL